MHNKVEVVLWNGKRKESLFLDDADTYILVDRARWKMKQLYGGNWIVNEVRR